MKKSIMEKWVAALRSGKYKQTTGQLRNEKGFCCLGVLCNLHAEAHPKFAAKQTDKQVYDGRCEVPTNVVLNWAGMKTDTGYIDSTGDELTLLNDNGDSFKKIAKIIEKHYKEL